MGLPVLRRNREYVKDSLTDVLASNGYISGDYRGDLDNETLENIDSLGVYEVTMDLEDKLDVEFSDEDIKNMFGPFEMSVETFMEGNRNSVRAKDVIDYIFEKL